MIMNTRSKLAGKSRELLMNTDIRLERIAVDCGLTLPWLARFKSKFGETEVPAADKVERLYEYLTGKVLEF
jgi:hypothetical protein